MSAEAIQKVTLDAVGKDINQELYQQKEPSASDAESFSRMMEANKQKTHAAVQAPKEDKAIQAVSAPHSADTRTSAKTQGDRILQSIQSVSEQFSQVMETAGVQTDQSSLGLGSVSSISQILKTQMALVKLSVGCDMFAKGTSQAAKNVNELTHMQ